MPGGIKRPLNVTQGLLLAVSLAPSSHPVTAVCTNRQTYPDFAPVAIHDVTKVSQNGEIREQKLSTKILTREL